MKLIPIIIENKRLGKVTDEENLILANTFGDLWQLIEDEATRDESVPINPLLKALLDANKRMLEYQLHTHKNPEVLFEKIWNDYHRRQLDKTAQKLTSAEDDRMSSTQRLMHIAAILIKRSYDIQQLQKDQDELMARTKYITVEGPKKSRHRRDINEIRYKFRNVASEAEMKVLMNLIGESREEAPNSGEEKQDDFSDYALDETYDPDEEVRRFYEAQRELADGFNEDTYIDMMALADQKVQEARRRQDDEDE